MDSEAWNKIFIAYKKYVLSITGLGVNHSCDAIEFHDNGTARVAS